jgi:hypothetical protein
VATDKLGNVYVLAGNGDYGVSVSVGSFVRKIDRAGNIETAVGNGLSGYGGEGIQATASSLSFSTLLAFDDSISVIYIAETDLNRVIKVQNEIMTTFAGNGSSFSAGDGGPATSASLYNPTGVAVDSHGNVFISERHAVRKVNTSGYIVTIAGNSTSGFAGDGGPASSALLSLPSYLTVGPYGNLYISDSNNNRVRGIDFSVNTISTVAGNGSDSTATLGGPATSTGISSVSGTSVDYNGNIYISLGSENFVAKVDASGIITSYAGVPNVPGYAGNGGPPSSANLIHPSDLALDNAGDLYIADTKYGIRKIANALP